jgi:hypothetical protein
VIWVLPIAGVLVEIVSGAVGTILVSTGFVAGGGLRSVAILRGSSKERVEWMTAAGFAIGAIFAGLFLFLDVVFG